MCVCVGGGGGGGGGQVTSFTFRNSRGVQHMLFRGGERQTFYQGSGVQLLSDRTCDLYWTPIPALDPHDYHVF